MSDPVAAAEVVPVPASASDLTVAGRRRFSTGKLLFFVLTLALAPLGAIAVGAGTQSIRNNDHERETLLTVSARDYGRRLAYRFARDGVRLETALAMVPRDQLAALSAKKAVPPRDESSSEAAPAAAVDPDVATATAMAASARAQAMLLEGQPLTNPYAPVCDAVSRAFPGTDEGQVQAQIIDRRDGRNVCTLAVPNDTGAINRPIGGIRIDEAERRLVHTVIAVGDHGGVELIYSLEAISGQLPSDGALPLNRLALATATDELLINQPGQDNVLGLDLAARAPVGRTGLVLALTAPRTWVMSSELVTLLTPLGMWLLAVLLSWLVVNSILLTPIQQLRRRMAEYRPGDTLSKPTLGLFTAQEVVTLDELMEKLAENVAEDKAALAQGLEAQRALTREVHHRVKNNLQIIASLISLHSRDAPSEVETRAYRAIQRRVDALAVVHRHLHAETEGSEGIALGTMLSELSVALRHSLAIDGNPTATTITVEPARAVQDVALPAAFFVTELFELAVMCSHHEPVEITLQRQTDKPGMAVLAVSSKGLVECSGHLGDRFGSYERVLTGLSRQLRQPLEVDHATGRYAIAVPIIG